MSLYSLFQRGGFAREKLQPRSAEAVSNAERFRPGLPPYRATPSDNIPNYFNDPYTPRGNVTDPFPVSSSDDGIFNTVNRRIQGNPVFQKAKNVYDWVDKNPWFPDIDIGDKQLGYDFNQPLMGGDLSYGFGYDIDDDDVSTYLNWGKTF